MKHLSAPESINPYYDRVSRKLRNIKYLLLLLLVISAILTLFAYRGRLTYDNFRYLLRDMDEAGHTTLTSDSVYYMAGDTNTFLYFRGDLAVASSAGIVFHRSFGSRSFSDAVTFNAPILVGSEKYMIAYDVGGSSFYVYNSLSRVYSETLESPIVACAAADNGNFAVLTKNSIGGYAIRVYDKNFKQIATLTREGYVYSIGFLESNRLYLCEALSEDASLYTDVSFYTVGTSEMDTTLRESGLVLRVGEIDDSMYLLSDRLLTFYDDSGEKTVFHSFGTADVLYADANAYGVCVLVDENASGTDYSAYTFFADGGKWEFSVEKGAKGLALCKETLCILYDDQIVVYSEDESANIDIPEGARTLLPKDSNSVIVCYSDYAKIFEVK